MSSVVPSFNGKLSLAYDSDYALKNGKWEAGSNIATTIPNTILPAANTTVFQRLFNQQHTGALNIESDTNVTKTISIPDGVYIDLGFKRPMVAQFGSNWGFVYGAWNLSFNGKIDIYSHSGERLGGGNLNCNAGGGATGQGPATVNIPQIQFNLNAISSYRTSYSWNETDYKLAYGTGFYYTITITHYRIYTDGYFTLNGSTSSYVSIAIHQPAVVCSNIIL